MEERLSKQALLSITNIISLMNTSDTLQQFLADIQHTLNSITYAENFYLALIDAKKKYITFPYYKDIKDDFTAETLDEIPLEKIFATLTFYAMRQKKVCVLTDADIQRLIDAKEVQVLGTIPKQWLCFPLLHKDIFLGVFVIQSYRNQQEYQGVIIDLLTAISYVLASALCAFNNHAALLEAHQELSQHKTQLEQLVQERTELLSQTVEKLQQEIEHSKNLQAQLEHKALHDALTGLYNREYLNQLMKHARTHFTYCAFFDLDGFKAVNDTHGHHTGDLLLVRVATHLSAICDKADVLIRNGGDEFIILIPPGTALDEVEARLWRCIRIIATDVADVGLEVEVGASVGLAVSDRHPTLNELLKAADAAMYRAKQAGRGQLIVAA